MIIHRVEHNRRRLPMHVHVCESRLERGRGLLLRRCPDQKTAYLLRNCSAIHTVGMTYPLDIVFCDEEGRILNIVRGLRPFRFIRQAGASVVWEMPAGAADLWGWHIGDRIAPC
ncbi:MAG TPA: DUF192 domain-containing protein [Steroidobacteraceae bacterium]|nr:DUF192 domain-containing protein [Steroidobacteraceae bacterium]